MHAELYINRHREGYVQCAYNLSPLKRSALVRHKSPSFMSGCQTAEVQRCGILLLDYNFGVGVKIIKLSNRIVHLYDNLKLFLLLVSSSNEREMDRLTVSHSFLTTHTFSIDTQCKSNNCIAT